MMAEIQGGRFERKVAGSVGSNLMDPSGTVGRNGAKASYPFGIGSRGDRRSETMTLWFMRSLSEGLRGWIDGLQINKF